MSGNFKVYYQFYVLVTEKRCKRKFLLLGEGGDRATEPFIETSTKRLSHFTVINGFERLNPSGSSLTKYLAYVIERETVKKIPTKFQVTIRSLCVEFFVSESNAVFHSFN